MTIPVPFILGLIYIVSEFGLAFKRRANADESQAADKGSLNLLWLVIVVSVTLSFMAAGKFRAADMGSADAATVVGTALFVAGLGLRWYSISQLGRFFTVNVAIARDHRVIDTGPYRFVRHPSYTGALLAFLGLSISVGNWSSVAVMMIPIFFVFVRRMQVEEAALLLALPVDYRHYMSRTKRLIPAIY